MSNLSTRHQQNSSQQILNEPNSADIYLECSFAGGIWWCYCPWRSTTAFLVVRTDMFFQIVDNKKLRNFLIMLLYKAIKF